MKIFGLHWLGHVTYCLVVAAFIFLGKQRVAQMAALTEDVHQVEPYLIGLYDKFSHIHQEEIQKTAQTCPTAANKQLLADAREILPVVDDWSGASAEFIRKLQSDNPPTDKNWIIPWVDTYRQFGQRLDSLSDHEPGAFSHFIINPAWPSARLCGMLAHADNLDASLLLHHLRFRLAAAAEQALQGISKRMDRDAPLVYTLLPAISMDDRSPVRAGKPMQSDVFLMAYTGNSQHTSLTATVNGQPAKIEQGVLRYEHIYPRPGIHKLAVVFSLKNEFTGEIRKYSKDFKVRIWGK